MIHAERWLCALGLVLLCAAGCGPAVREDRSWTFSKEGSEGGFQHGHEGMFITEKEGSAPIKIFQPGPEVVAVSSPLWAPQDRRLIFTTARRDGQLPTAAGESDPAGDLYLEGPTVYTCWLRAQPQGTGQPEPVALFEAACDHPAYIAANLAVRWSPDGKRILHVRATAEGRHSLFAYDIRSKATSQVFPYEAAGLAFDFSPNGKYLACAVADRENGSGPTQLWLGQLGAGNWWAVPSSAQSLSEPHATPLARARALVPVWRPDGEACAFYLHRPASPHASERAQIILARPAERKAEVVAEGRAPFRDLHWRPDGLRLGAMEGTSRLVAIDPRTRSCGLLTSDAVTEFASWNATGTQVAWVNFESIPGARDTWALLFVPDRRARMAIQIRAESGSGKARRVFGDMQITFPRWSAAGEKLSLWATFRPSWRSWMSFLLQLLATPTDPLRGLRLQTGDPALLIDCRSGRLQWQATSPREQDQVGHYYLLQHDYTTAWHWYQRAREARLAKGEKDSGETALFRAICLKRLRRDEECAGQLQHFAEHFLDACSPKRSGSPAAAPPGTIFGAAGPAPTDAQLHHWQDLYAAEVFLALDEVSEGETFFRRRLARAHTEDERLSSAAVLTQLLLVSKKHSEYADLTSATVLPLLLRAWKPFPSSGHSSAPLDWTNALIAYGDGLSLVPLWAPEFLAKLESRQIRRLLPAWQAARKLADDDVKRLVVDLILSAAYRRLGQDTQALQAQGRVNASPLTATLLGSEGVEGLVKLLRRAPEMIEELEQPLSLR